MFVLFWLMIYVQGISQKKQLTFKHLGIDDGLSQNSVTCLLQDKTGFVWIGTHDGLNRYDGHNFVHYRNKRSDRNSISNNYITDIYEDHNGILWIATFGGGLNSLNPVNGQIHRYSLIPDDSASFPSNRLFSITEYPAGILWIGSNEGLIRLEVATGYSRMFLAQRISDFTYAYNFIGTVKVDECENLWLRSDSGLTRIDVNTFEVKHFKKGPYSGIYGLGDVYDIECVNGLVIVACDAGLIEINPKFETDRLIVSPKDIHSLSLPFEFRRVLLLDPNRYAIGSNSGLIIFDSDTKETSLFQSDAADGYSLSHNAILSLFKSSDGILWIGTRNGLNKIESEYPNFIHIRKIVGKVGLSSNNVNSFIQENDSLLWIATTDGFNLFNLKKGTIRDFRMDGDEGTELTSDYMLCLFQDSKGSKWLGTRNGGFYRIENQGDEAIKIIKIKPNNIEADYVTVHFITEGHDGSLWIGTGGAGLWRYNPSDNSVKQYPSAKDGSGPNHPYVFTILSDNYGNIWLGTPIGGLNLYNPQTETFLYFQHEEDNINSLSNDIVLSLHEDRYKNLWIGTNGGLNRLIPKLNKDIFQQLNSAMVNGDDSLFVNFGYEQGFPNDVIYGMLEDRQRKLWISTNKGLIVFDMEDQQVERTFDVSDGLQSNEFNQNGYLAGKDGWFYFGGVNGFNMFQPGKIRENSFMPLVVITGMALYNQPVEVGKKQSNGKILLENQIQYLDEIRLSYQHNFITFNFAALSFISPEKNQYSYMLEGLNNSWVHNGTSRSATFTHLPPGNYTLKVRASNNSGVWSEKIEMLKIHISTPPWLSWYAFLIYFIIVLAAGYLFLRFRINRATRELMIKSQIEKARSQEREAFRKKSAADFHDEAGNKITKISLFTEMARNEMDNSIQLENYLKKIQSNVTELSAGMRDFLWVLDPQQDSLFETISRLKDYGDSSLSDIGVRFTLNGMNANYREIALPMNTRRDILQIFKEAINNCVKYAEASRVVLTVRVVEDQIVISLSDDGKGFDPSGEVMRNKYGLSIMRERAKKIDAELLITSQKNKGTTISLKCNIPHMGNSY